MENACLGFLLVTLSLSYCVKLHVNPTLLCFRMSCCVLTFCNWRPNTTSLSSCCMTTYLWVQIKVTQTDLGLNYWYIFIFFSFNRAARDHRLKCLCCWGEKKNQSPRTEVKQTRVYYPPVSAKKKRSENVLAHEHMSWNSSECPGNYTLRVKCGGVFRRWYHMVSADDDACRAARRRLRILADPLIHSDGDCP